LINKLEIDLSHVVVESVNATVVWLEANGELELDFSDYNVTVAANTTGSVPPT